MNVVSSIGSMQQALVSVLGPIDAVSDIGMVLLRI